MAGSVASGLAEATGVQGAGATRAPGAGASAGGVGKSAVAAAQQQSQWCGACSVAGEEDSSPVATRRMPSVVQTSV